MLTLVAFTLPLWGLQAMKTYWESENSSLVLAAIVLWLRLYHLQNKCISEPKVGQMFTVFYFKETGINAKAECMTIKALQEMEVSSLMKSTCKHQSHRIKSHHLKTKFNLSHHLKTKLNLSHHLKTSQWEISQSSSVEDLISQLELVYRNLKKKSFGASAVKVIW